MVEIELKLQVPAAQRAAVDAAVAGRTPAPRQRLQAAYFDTGERLLAANRLALRLRREGRQWVQTLKGATDDGLLRHEHNVPRGTGAAMPALEPALHAGTPVGDRLLALMAARPADALRPLYSTDIRRRTRVVRLARAVREMREMRVARVGTAGSPQGRVELAFDSGRIEAGGAVVEVSELEIESLAGPPQAVIDTARRWVARHRLWIDTRSKAERGDLLSRGEPMAPARRAQPVRLLPSMSAAEAWQGVARSCADQVLANASQIATGPHAPEHVHQLRVGLRRLRSALALFERGDDASTALGNGAAELFKGLGASRDAAVVDAEFGAALQAAMGVAAVAGVAAAPPVSPALARADDYDAAELLRDPASQHVLLDLLAATQAAAGADGVDGTPLRERLAARLNHWHRQVVAGAKHYAELDDEARHRLRKRAKRLRYATEFCADLFDRRGVRRYTRALADVQERLGTVSDVLMALAWFAGRGDADPRAMFARGWLAARRDAVVNAAAPALRAFVKTERYWQRKRPAEGG